MRILKSLWFHTVMVATVWLPDLRPILQLRGLLLRPAFRVCGPNLQVARRVTINFSNNLEIGRDVFLGTGCWVHAHGGIVLEDGVQVGPYAVLVAVDHTRIGESYRFGPPSLAPIRVCRGAWIAAHATVTKGVVIGPGALLGANSVATHDVPPFAMAGGVPARVVQKPARFEVVG
jgi:acetyltransferase-like isoleucine patch superfamily enzyme